MYWHRERDVCFLLLVIVIVFVVVVADVDVVAAVIVVLPVEIVILPLRTLYETVFHTLGSFQFFQVRCSTR